MLPYACAPGPQVREDREDPSTSLGGGGGGYEQQRHVVAAGGGSGGRPGSSAAVSAGGSRAMQHSCLAALSCLLPPLLYPLLPCLPCPYP